MLHDRSLALRWFDVNQINPEVAEQLRKGVYQDMIPYSGGTPPAGVVADIERRARCRYCGLRVTNDVARCEGCGAPQ